MPLQTSTTNTSIAPSFSEDGEGENYLKGARKRLKKTGLLGFSDNVRSPGKKMGQKLVQLAEGMDHVIQYPVMTPVAVPPPIKPKPSRFKTAATQQSEPADIDSSTTMYFPVIDEDSGRAVFAAQHEFVQSLRTQNPLEGSAYKESLSDDSFSGAAEIHHSVSRQATLPTENLPDKGETSKIFEKSDSSHLQEEFVAILPHALGSEISQVLQTTFDSASESNVATFDVIEKNAGTSQLNDSVLDHQEEPSENEFSMVEDVCEVADSIIQATEVAGIVPSYASYLLRVTGEMVSNAENPDDVFKNIRTFFAEDLNKQGELDYLETIYIQSALGLINDRLSRGISSEEDQESLETMLKVVVKECKSRQFLKVFSLRVTAVLLLLERIDFFSNQQESDIESVVESVKELQEDQNSDSEWDDEDNQQAESLTQCITRLRELSRQLNSKYQLILERQGKAQAPDSTFAGLSDVEATFLNLSYIVSEEQQSTGELIAVIKSLQIPVQLLQNTCAEDEAFVQICGQYQTATASLLALAETNLPSAVQDDVPVAKSVKQNHHLAYVGGATLAASILATGLLAAAPQILTVGVAAASPLAIAGIAALAAAILLILVFSALLTAKCIQSTNVEKSLHLEM